LANEHPDVLFTKPANAEQLQIALHLAASGRVQVQGPPGTGKTHTIGNLIGHLLAQGKRILVTSHSTKALRMVRQQVAPDLRPLCVSVLDRDERSRDQLKESVNAIVAKMSDNPNDLLRQVAMAQEQRNRVLQQLQEARTRQMAARASEYRPIVMAGKSIEPSEAARIIASGAGAHAWIPGPLESGAPLPLSPAEIVELYRLNSVITYEDERDLVAGPLPSLQALPVPVRFADTVRRLYDSVARTTAIGKELWNQGVNPTPEELEDLRNKVAATAESLRATDGLKTACIQAGITGGDATRIWDTLCERIAAAEAEALRKQLLLLDYRPQLVDDSNFETQVAVAREIVAHLESGGRVGWLEKLTKPAWKKTIQGWRVRGTQPSTMEEFQTILATAELSLLRLNLIALWQAQCVPLGATLPDQSQPESQLAQFVPLIRQYVGWHGAEWKPLQARLLAAGLSLPRLIDRLPTDAILQGELAKLRVLLEQLLPVLQARADTRRYEILWEEYQRLITYLAKFSTAHNAITFRLQQATSSSDVGQYADAYRRLADLEDLAGPWNRQVQLLSKLERPAPIWAADIRKRTPPHQGPDCPGDPHAAWTWRQISDELNRRNSEFAADYDRDLSQLTTQLQTHTVNLVNSRTWEKQIRRTTLTQQQALTGWLQTEKTIGRGTGKRVPRLRAEARRLLRDGQSAVPVWIMPLSRVVENFDVGTTGFDVVIIDEASQADLLGLLAWYMGKEIIVVGDDEQVSPVTVGLEVDVLQSLQDAYLRDVPNWHLYDGTRSVYDLAATCFSTVIQLVEHFRSVPDIIAFSNYLSYNGAIKPLREPSSAAIFPPLVPYRVEGATSDDKVNGEEAKALASLVVAALEQSEYGTSKVGEPLTVGVISLLGEEQAVRIERLLRSMLSPGEFDRRRILCGNAAQFQGDERDLVFLSMVDTPRDNGPLPIRQVDLFKKRFNVAASRARDQMWVIYSVDPGSDLKPGDLRRRLIEHAIDPQSLQRMYQQAATQTESEFEKQVLERLISRGFRVTPQYQAGHYRIDLVVESNGRRLAIECDGDRYHPDEKLREDAERQAILERFGWKFVRIRGTRFFQDPDAALQPLWNRLQQLGIEPDGTTLESAPVVDTAHGLVDRIVRRAADVRRGLISGSSDEPISIEYTPAIEEPSKQIKPDAPSTAAAAQPQQRSQAAPNPNQPASLEQAVVQRKDAILQPTIPKSHVGQGNGDKAPKSLDGSSNVAPRSLVAILLERGLQVVDNRDKGGSLWVIGGRELDLSNEEFARLGARFWYLPKGGRATQNKPGWFTKSKS
ncbi:MAG: AAA domain-containing protein, partial [Dehalococcoidia bacterium]|nr:AAA domain-containing protein [Dehalococcoidia bacterium]